MKWGTAARRNTTEGICAPISARRQTAHGVCVLLSIVGLLWMGCVQAVRGGEERFDFRGSRFDNARLTVLGEGTAQLLVPEADGLRIAIPQGAAVDEVGFAPRFRLRGDFEIIATFELIHLPSPKSGYGVGPRIYIGTATEDEQAATVARLRRVREGDVFSAHNARYAATKDAGRERTHRTVLVPATGKVGRIGLRRTGTNLQYLASDGEGGNPAEIGSWTFTAADVSSVRMSLHGHGAAAAGEMRWKDVVIRADEFVRPHGSRWAGRLLALGALLVPVAVGIGVWRYRRRRA
jgi:hypothetical protein